MIGSFRVPLLRDGFRMVVFSVVIMIIVLFFRRGIMGDKELPDVMRNLGKKISQKKLKAKEGATDENGTEA
jgi:branched-chain amino acid transport system permease protein